MNGMLRRMLTLGIAMTSIVGIAGCGSSSDSGSEANKITMIYADDQNSSYKTMAKLYTKDTGVNVNAMEVPYDDLGTKISNAAKADDLPDVARVGQLDPVWLDQLQDLSDVAKTAKAKSNFLVKSSDGKILTIPSDLTAVGLFINTTLFDKAGVSYPKTSSDSWSWTDFISSVKKVQAATDAKYGLVMDASSHRERALMYQFGSKGVTKKSDGSWGVDGGARKALTFLKSIDDDKVMPKSVWASNEDPSALFKSGKVAAYYSGSWQISDFSDSISSFEWKSVVMPSQPTRATNVGTNYMVAFTPAGKKFLKWFYSSQNYKKFCEEGSYLPVTENVTPTYAKRNEDMQMYIDEIAKSNQKVLTHQVNVQLELAMKGAVLPSDDPMKEETVKYLSGEQSLDTTISNMNTAFTKYYNETNE